MELSEALDIFGIDDITQETEANIKKRYKKLMIKYHPDNVGGDDSKAKEVSLAMDIIKEALVNVARFKALNKASEKITIVIPIHKLIELYNGGNMTLGSGEDRHLIGKKEIQKYNTLIISDATITHNGIVYNFSNVQPWSIADSYEINCDIYVDNINNEEIVKVHIEDYDKEIKFISQSIVLKVTLKFNINVAIRITKKTIDKSKE